MVSTNKVDTAFSSSTILEPVYGLLSRKAENMGLFFDALLKGISFGGIIILQAYRYSSQEEAE